MMSSRLLFILPGLPDYVPYVYNYFKIAELCGKEYDVVCWNRRGIRTEFPHNFFVYNHQTSDDYPPFRKLKEIFCFSRFVRETIRGRRYAAVFSYTIADTLFFSHWLSRCYKSRFVFDIRDYSPLINNFFSRWFVNQLLRASAINVISSDGFRKWLPKEFDYTICHNTNLEKVRQARGNFELQFDDMLWKRDNSILKILTIGMIRDFDSNVTIVDSFSNRKGVQLQFAGSGSEKIQHYSETKRIKNISFGGRYKKEEEDDIVKQADMINLFLPHTLNSDTCMGNRMYLAARLRKPIIVTDNSWQAEMVKKYNLGICVEWNDDLGDKILDYWTHLDWFAFEKGCQDFLKQVENDMCLWETKVKNVMML